jgi:spore coat protein CotH
MHVQATFVKYNSPGESYKYMAIIAIRRQQRLMNQEVQEDLHQVTMVLSCDCSKTVTTVTEQHSAA